LNFSQESRGTQANASRKWIGDFKVKFFFGLSRHLNFRARNLIYRGSDWWQPHWFRSTSMWIYIVVKKSEPRYYGDSPLDKPFAIAITTRRKFHNKTLAFAALSTPDNWLQFIFGAIVSGLSETTRDLQRSALLRSKLKLKCRK
jgi:hypothetical protein